MIKSGFVSDVIALCLGNRKELKSESGYRHVAVINGVCVTDKAYIYALGNRHVTRRVRNGNDMSKNGNYFRRVRVRMGHEHAHMCITHRGR